MIKASKKPNKFKVVCRHCRSTIRFTLDEIEDNPSTSDARWIHCPNCQSKIYVIDQCGDILESVKVIRW